MVHHLSQSWRWGELTLWTIPVVHHSFGPGPMVKSWKMWHHYVQVTHKDCHFSFKVIDLEWRWQREYMSSADSNDWSVGPMLRQMMSDQQKECHDQLATACHGHGKGNGHICYPFALLDFWLSSLLTTASSNLTLQRSKCSSILCSWHVSPPRLSPLGTTYPLCSVMTCRNGSLRTKATTNLPTPEFPTSSPLPSALATWRSPPLCPAWMRTISRGVQRQSSLCTPSSSTPGG